MKFMRRKKNVQAGESEWHLAAFFWLANTLRKEEDLQLQVDFKRSVAS